MQTGTRTRTCRPWTGATASGSKSLCWCCAWPQRTAWRARCCAGEDEGGLHFGSLDAGAAGRRANLAGRAPLLTGSWSTPRHSTTVQRQREADAGALLEACQTGWPSAPADRLLVHAPAPLCSANEKLMLERLVIKKGAFLDVSGGDVSCSYPCCFATRAASCMCRAGPQRVLMLGFCRLRLGTQTAAGRAQLFSCC